MWDTVDFGRYFVNSLIICSVAALARDGVRELRRLRARPLPLPRLATPFSLTVVGTQLIPGSMFLLPIFLGFIWLKQNTPIACIDTHLGMILVYTAFFTPVAIFLMRAFFLAIPRELEEAALVDGCTRFGAFVRVVLPERGARAHRHLRLRVPLRVGRAAVRHHPHRSATRRRSRSGSAPSSATTSRSTTSSWPPASSRRCR